MRLSAFRLPFLFVRWWCGRPQGAPLRIARANRRSVGAALVAALGLDALQKLGRNCAARMHAPARRSVAGFDVLEFQLRELAADHEVVVVER